MQVVAMTADFGPDDGIARAVKTVILSLPDRA
jgi:S-adenosylmethionine hydrolase